MTQVDAILNLHREGEMLLPSFRSIQQNLKLLGREGIEAGLIVVLDCPDPSTRELIAKLQNEFKFDSTEIEMSDLSRSRNHAVNRSTAEFIDEAKKPREIGVEMHSNRPKALTMLLEHFGYTVERLDRTVLGPLTKKDLPRGHWRTLDREELNLLRMSL